MNKEIIKNQQANRRAIRTRAKISGTALRPRLSVFKSNLYISAQLIDDESKKTILGVHSKKATVTGTKSAKAKALGQEIAKQALAKNIKKVIFDRGPFPYQGRVKALAEGAREAGLEF